MKLVNDRGLSFLDTLLTRREDESIGINVYWKTTHTDRFLQYTSHHLEHDKRGVASCVLNRARFVATGEISGKERHVTEVL